MEGAEHRGILETDHSRTDDDHIAGNLLLSSLEELIGVEDLFSVARDLVVARRARTARDQEMIASQAHRTVVGLHFDGVRVHEASGSLENFDAVALELGPHHLELALEDDQDASGEILDRDVLLDRVVAAVEAALTDSRQVEDRLA
jgi:hypothetical protein